MKKNIAALFKLFALINLLIIALLSMPDQASAGEHPVIWKYQAKGQFADVVDNLKAGLEAGQFLVSSEEDLAKGLENNRHILGGEKNWNTIGFKHATAIHFCSIRFNHEAFNMDMNLSYLCPFKVVAYTMINSPQTVNIITLRPTYLLKTDKRKTVRQLGKRIEDRIINAIMGGIKPKM